MNSAAAKCEDFLFAHTVTDLLVLLLCKKCLACKLAMTMKLTSPSHTSTGQIKYRKKSLCFTHTHTHKKKTQISYRLHITSKVF